LKQSSNKIGNKAHGQARPKNYVIRKRHGSEIDISNAILTETFKRLTSGYPLLHMIHTYFWVVASIVREWLKVAGTEGAVLVAPA
jgi:hypothetical protein